MPLLRLRKLGRSGIERIDGFQRHQVAAPGRLERAERIGSDAGPGARDPRQQGRLAGVRQAHQADIGDQLQLQVQIAFFAIGYKKDVDAAETLPEPQRQNVQEFLKTQRKYHEQEIEHFRREIPNGRFIVFTNADHQFPLDREDEVLREMRKFLSQ